MKKKKQNLQCSELPFPPLSNRCRKGLSIKELNYSCLTKLVRMIKNSYFKKHPDYINRFN